MSLISAVSDAAADSVDARIDRLRRTEITLRLEAPDGVVLPAGTVADIRLSQHDFLFGCNFFAFEEYSESDDATYRQRFSDVFNLAVLPFYWMTYEPKYGQLARDRWTRAAEWCHARGIRTKGHPLLWTLEPDWLPRFPDRQRERLLWERIDREVHEFGALIDIWDVVNEPVRGPRQAAERKARAVEVAYRRGTPTVVQHAFRLARRANSKAQLVLNDVDTGNAYRSVIRQSLSAGAQIDAIGIQSHMHTENWTPQKAWRICDQFSEFKLPIHFTEITILSGDLKSKWDNDWSTTRSDWHSTARGESIQSQSLRGLYRTLFSHPNVEAIIWWDLSDRGAWLGAPAGLLRKDLSPKPAYETLRSLVRDEWTTQEKASIRDSALSFRGFYGDYRVGVAIDGRKLEGHFSVPKGSAPGVIDVKLK